MSGDGPRRVLEALKEVHRKWCRVVSAGRTGGGSPGPRNPKGDVQAPFDLEAHEFLVREIRRVVPDAEILSEEQDPPRAGAGGPARPRVVVDPVDGSDNLRLGLPLAGLSIALVPRGEPLRAEAVTCALVGPADGQEAYAGCRGGGAWRGRVRLRTSGVARLRDAFLSVELNHHLPGPGLGRVLAAARGVRSYGCASRAICLVAAGRLDAHIDIRGRLTAESFLAASRILLEAGGYLCTPDGLPVPAVGSLQERVSLIAAASRELAGRICDELGCRASTGRG